MTGPKYQLPEERKGSLMQQVVDLLDSSGITSAPVYNEDKAYDECVQLLEQTAKEDESKQGLLEEVPEVLQQMMDGERVVLDGLPDPEVRTFLAHFFFECGLREKQDEDGGSIGFGLPEEGLAEVEGLVSRVVKRYRKVEPAPRGPVGPARPSETQLAAAAHIRPMDDESSEDEGPMVAGKATRQGAARAEESQKEKMVKKLKRAAEWEKVTGVDQGAAEALEAIPKGREQWMLDPPKSVGALAGLKTLQPTNRTFQTRSQRGLRADAEKAANKPRSRAEVEAQMKAEKVLAEHKKLRGPSLAELHKGKGRASNEGGGGGKKQFSWDKERDFDKSKKFSKGMYQDLVNKSKELDTKFTRYAALHAKPAHISLSTGSLSSLDSLNYSP
ncbi:unnamed protein product [Chrysoparadoxa australica]